MEIRTIGQEKLDLDKWVDGVGADLIRKRGHVAEGQDWKEGGREEGREYVIGVDGVFYLAWTLTMTGALRYLHTDIHIMRGHHGWPAAQSADTPIILVAALLPPPFLVVPRRCAEVFSRHNRHTA